MIYKKLVPPDSFIGQYLQHMQGIETAEAYDFWCALWLIGVAVGRSTFVARPRSPVYLNWYIVLASESGVTRKSTAVRAAMSVASSLGPVISRRTVPEQLEKSLHRQSRDTGECSAVLVAPEMVTILGRETYMKTLPGVLTDLYDCPDSRRNENSYLRNVFVTLLSASTPTWLVTAMNPSVIEGGFTSRVIFVTADERKKAIPWPKEEEDGKTDVFVQHLQGARDTAKSINELSTSPGALRKFSTWYCKRLGHRDPYRSSFEAREDDHVLRAAACLAVNDNTWEIQSGHIGAAIRLVAQAKDCGSKLFSEVIGTPDRLSAGIDRVRQVLVEAGLDGMKHHATYKKVLHYMDPSEFAAAISVMHELGMVQVFRNPGKKGQHYRATQKMLGFGLTNEVLGRLGRSQV